MKVYTRVAAGFTLLAIALTFALTSSSQAATKSPSSALMAPVVTAFNGFNAGNKAMWLSAQGEDVVILDDFAPYRWDGPDASSKWWADFVAWMKANNMSKPHVTHTAIQFWEQTGDQAYMVVPTTFTAVQKGKPVTNTGTLTIVLAKTGAGWKIHGWTWGTTSMK